MIGGSSESAQESMGAFQEFPQVAAAKHFSKYAARPASLSQIPLIVEKVKKITKYGKIENIIIKITNRHIELVLMDVLVQFISI